MKKKAVPYLLVSPYNVHFFIFIAFPVIFSIVLIFHKWNIISPMEYSGFGNYLRLFQDTLILKSILNTLIFLIIHIPLQIIVAFVLAEVRNQ
jgi:ABC-type sugar transport system permease subunit